MDSLDSAWRKLKNLSSPLFNIIFWLKNCNFRYLTIPFWGQKLRLFPIPVACYGSMPFLNSSSINQQFALTYNLVFPQIVAIGSNWGKWRTRRGLPYIGHRLVLPSFSQICLKIKIYVLIGLIVLPIAGPPATK